MTPPKAAAVATETCPVCGREPDHRPKDIVCIAIGYQREKARADRLAGALRAIVDDARRALGEEPGR